MKKVGLFLLAIVLEFTILAQAPQGFKYQAVVRDGTGQVQMDKNLKIKLGLLQDSPTGTLIWEEEHDAQTNGFGLVNLMVGDPGATVTGGSAATFDQIDWSAGNYYLQVQVDLMDGTGYQDLGTTQLLSVPYALYSGDVSNKDDADADPTNEIQDLQLNNDTLTITNNGSATPIDLSPYNDNPWTVGGDTLSHVTGSVAIGTDLPGGTKLAVQGDDTLSTKPLFEVKRKDGQTVFAVYNDSIRMYVNSNLTAKGAKGGFAIGGFGAAKGAVQDYLRVTPDSVRIYIDQTPGKGPRGGFAIGGFGAAKGGTTDLMRLNKDNYFIGHQSGEKNTTGLYNQFFGYQAGRSNTTGETNVFMGYQAGYNNTSGSDNVLLGFRSGYNINTGNSNIYIGILAGYRNDMSSDNIFLGRQAGYNHIYGNVDNIYKSNYNIYIGHQAGFGSWDGDSSNLNIFIGNQAGYSIKSGSDNVFIGDQAGYSNVSSHWNVYLGLSSGKYCTGAQNVFLGGASGAWADGTNNCYIGAFSGRGLPAPDMNTGTANTFMGYSSGIGNLTGSYNVFLGMETGANNGAGNNNVYIGYHVANQNDGSGNVFIGYNAGGAVTSTNDKLIIANNSSTNLIEGDFSEKTVTINDVLTLTPRTTAPLNPVEGQIYVNSSDHHIYCYLNGSWKPLD